ncbi:MAG TPA: 3-methyl-2-oxobutanoate hydroxymethyltransferase, partial [Syntrophales bacterium]|nr:3-methyl-2-oxobutanoate hydroxymethyltransferase [Syntrophales bacterium]
TPQSVHQLGGYKIQGKDDATAKKLIEDARMIEEAGAFSVVLECVPSALAGKISQAITIPTIGIGAGVYCDGQVLVINDMLGMFERFTPKFVKKYANLNAQMKEGVKKYIDEVKSGAFPDEEHSI